MDGKVLNLESLCSGVTEVQASAGVQALQTHSCTDFHVSLPLGRNAAILEETGSVSVWISGRAAQSFAFHTNSIALF